MSDPRIWMPGPGQTAPLSPLPAGSLAGGGWLEPKSIPVPLLKVNTSGTQRLTANVAARIDNPAARLICSMSLSFEPEVAQDVPDFNGALWSLTAMRPGGKGREARLHLIFEDEVLPQQYEVSTSARSFLLEATLTIPQTAASADIAGTWKLVCEWEPAMPMCSEEVAALYARCGAEQVLFAAGPLAP